MTYDELDVRQYALAYAIAGGEDVPGLLDTVSTEDLVGLIKAERAQARDTQDALVAAAAADAWNSAIRAAEKAMREECTAEYGAYDMRIEGHIARAEEATVAVGSQAILALIG